MGDRVVPHAQQLDEVRLPLLQRDFRPKDVSALVSVQPETDGYRPCTTHGRALLPPVGKNPSELNELKGVKSKETKYKSDVYRPIYFPVSETTCGGQGVHRGAKCHPGRGDVTVPTRDPDPHRPPEWTGHTIDNC